MANQLLVDGRHYRLGLLLGNGGQATVHRIEPMQHGAQPLARKTFKEPLTYRAEVRILHRIAQEARHDNVISTIALSEPTISIVMPWIPGGTLFQLISHVRLTDQEIAFVLRGVLTGLEALHGWGIVHCDLKPDNILLRQDGEPVISDFGLGLMLGEAMHGHGTRGYKSPEMARAKVDLASGRKAGPVSTKADIFAVPLIGIECVLEGETLYKQKVTAADIACETPTASERYHYVFNRLRAMYASLPKAPPLLATFAGDSLTTLGRQAPSAAKLKNSTFIKKLANHGRAGFVQAVQLTTKLNEKKAVEHDLNEIQDRLRLAGALREPQSSTNQPNATKRRDETENAGETPKAKSISHRGFHAKPNGSSTNEINAATALGLSRKTTRIKQPKRRDSGSTSSEPLKPPSGAATAARHSRKSTRISRPKIHDSDPTSSQPLKPPSGAATAVRLSRRPTRGKPPRRRASTSSPLSKPRSNGATKVAAAYKCPHSSCPQKATTFTRKYYFDDHMRAHDGHYDCGPCADRLWTKRAWDLHLISDKHAKNVAKRSAKTKK